MKTIGIIGGCGPVASAKFYLRVTEAFRQRTRTQPQIVMWNVSVPQSLENDLLIGGKNIRKFIPLITKAAQNLEKAGADVIVLPCNTLHLLADDIRQAIHVPFIDIIDATLSILRQHPKELIGILGTKLTVEQNLFRDRAPELKFLVPNPEMQASIDIELSRCIQDFHISNLTRMIDGAAISLQKRGAKTLLIACTDFHGICSTIPGIHLVDTLEILVSKTVNVAIENHRESML